MQWRHRPLVGSALAGLALAATLALVLGPVPAGEAGTSCANADARPHSVELYKLRRAIACLVNQARHRHDRRPLDRRRGLGRAARRHTRYMFRSDCMAHQCPGEPDLVARVSGTRYLDATKAWSVGENLGYDATPRKVVRDWLAAPGHRRNLLSRSFTDMGIGAHRGCPSCAKRGYVTYTIDLGWRQH